MDDVCMPAWYKYVNVTRHITVQVGKQPLSNQTPPIGIVSYYCLVSYYHKIMVSGTIKVVRPDQHYD
jgi:hypothetical protein